MQIERTTTTTARKGSGATHATRIHEGFGIALAGCTGRTLRGAALNAGPVTCKSCLDGIASGRIVEA